MTFWQMVWLVVACAAIAALLGMAGAAALIGIMIHLRVWL